MIMSEIGTLASHVNATQATRYLRLKCFHSQCPRVMLRILFFIINAVILGANIMTLMRNLTCRFYCISSLYRQNIGRLVPINTNNFAGGLQRTQT